MLKKIGIQGFRGFENYSELDFAIPNNTEGSGLTIITGPNNSGKSSILECIKARNGRDNPSFSVGTRNAISDYIIIDFEFDTHSEKITSVAKGSSETNRSGHNSNVQTYVVPSRRNFQSYFGKHIMERDSFISNEKYNGKRGFTIDNFTSRLFKISANPGEFNLLLNEVIGYEVEWRIDQSEQDNYFLKFLNGIHSHSSAGLGEGIVSLFVILDSLYDSKVGDMIVIDEPELSLHPSLQKRLMKIFLRFSKDRQIIISTHSPYFVDLNSVMNGAAICRVISENNVSTVFQLKAIGREALSKLTRVNINNPHVFGLEARELFFKEDKVIITEGQEDVVLFPDVANQLNLSFEGEFFGWGAGGAGNITHLCTILQELGFEKVVAILDGDQLKEKNKLSNQFPDYLFFVLPTKDIRTKAAQPSRNEVEGLLGLDYLIKEEHKSEIINLIQDINTFLEVKQT